MNTHKSTRKQTFFVTLSLVAVLLGVSQCHVAAQTSKAVPGYGHLPMQFEPNRGQAHSKVKFLSRGAGYTVLLQPDTATFQLTTSVAIRNSGASSTHRPEKINAIQMHLLAANDQAVMAAERPLFSYVNYMSGEHAARYLTGIPTFAATRVSSVYPGIDLVYYGSQRRLEYDFVLTPGAEAGKIHLAIKGAKPSLKPTGELTLQIGKHAAQEDLTFLKPVLYQEVNGTRQSVDGGFLLAADGTVGFRVGAYDHTRNLVIDPVINYASYFGGSLYDYIYGSARNASSQLYAVGSTTSTNLPATTGEFQPTYNSNTDAFVTKFSADGSTILWTTYLGGAGADAANAVAVNASDQAYVTGSTEGQGFPISADALQSLCGPVGQVNANGVLTGEISGCGSGSPDAFLVKLSSDGKSLLYGTFLGGSSNDSGDSVALDATGNIFLGGTTLSTSFDRSTCAQCEEPGYPANINGTPGFGYADFPTTSTAYAQAYSLAESQAPPGTDNDGQNAVAGTWNAFLSVLSADGHSLLYSSTIGGLNIGNCGNGDCYTGSEALAVSPQGIAYLGGVTSSASFPVTANAFAASCSTNGGSPAICSPTGWLASFDMTKSGAASRVFSTYMTGTAPTTGTPSSSVQGLTTDALGNVYVTGSTNSSNFPTTSGVLQPSCRVNGNGYCIAAYISKLAPAGSTVWSTYYGVQTAALGDASGNGIAVDASDNVFVVGATNQGTMQTKNSIASPGGGGDDAFVLELSPDASTLILGTYLGSSGGITVSNNSLSLDGNDNAYFTGSQGYNGGNQTFPLTANAPDKVLLGSEGWAVKMITQAQPTTTSLTLSATTAKPTQTVTLTATVNSAATTTGTAIPTGTVSFMNGSTVLGTGMVNQSGVATFAGMFSNGIYQVTAVYPGDLTFGSSNSAPATLTISSSTATTTTLTVTPATTTYGQAVTLSSTSVAGSSPVTSGTITFTAGTMPLGTASVNSSGIATVTVTPSPGIYSVVASYGGSMTAGFSSSSSAGVPLTIQKSAPTISLAASPTLAAPGTAVKFSAVVASTVGSPSGSVSFMDGSTLLGSGTITAGSASYSSALPVGSYTVTAVYSGDTDFSTVTSTSTSVVIRALAPTTTTVTSSAIVAALSSSITFTAKIATSVTSGSPSGTATFYDGTTSIGTGAVSSNTASLTTSSLAAGSHNISTVYSGDSLFQTSASMAIVEVISAPSVQIVATPSTLTIPHGGSGTSTIAATPFNGYNNILTLTCKGLPQYASCSFSTAALTVTPTGGTVNDTLTLTTVQRAALSQPSFFGRSKSGSVLAFCLPLSLLGLAGLRNSKHTKKRLQSLTLIVVLLCGGVGAATLTGCGGGAASTLDAAPGTYSGSIVAAGSDGTSQTVAISVVIQ